MRKGHAIVLGQHEFATKSAATAFFRSMLHRYKVGERVTYEDALDLSSLLERHPQAAEKIGPGVDHFEVMAADYNTRCFCIVRTDMTIEKFSYPICIASSN